MSKRELPNYIKNKIERLENYLNESNKLRAEIERYLEDNLNIDYDTCREEYIFDDVQGCGHGIDIVALQEYLRQRNE